MNSKLTILMAQINPTVGALEANRDKIIQIIKDNQKNHELIIFPELALCGYPPEDLLLRTEFHEAVLMQLDAIKSVVKECHIILGLPTLQNGQCYNTLCIVHQGQVIKTYHKQMLPNYGVFDERRYFTPGKQDACILELKGQKIGLCICEDIWHSGPVHALIDAGASAIVSINASPFDNEKQSLREKIARLCIKRGVGFIYVNQVGGQDELIFDGCSFAMDKSGVICAQLPAFEEHLATVVLSGQTIKGENTPLLSTVALIYKALVFATREYVLKNNFPGVLIGLSGGIDSALTLAIAVDALSADRVHAVLMPSRYSAQISSDDALEQVQKMKTAHTTIPIEPIFKSFLTALDPLFSGLEEDSTEENLQARIRGMLLMAMSNKMGKMVLSTSNKSETAVGYATLYGDMAGGFAVLKDVLKTQVYALAEYRNSLGDVIPQRVITRAPSAELRENQTDQDSLPDYAVLDAIIDGYVVQRLSCEELIAQGLDSVAVHEIIHFIKRNEYKRRQAAPGPKISTRAFDKDWRYPITCGA